MSNCKADCREFIGVAGVTPDGVYKRTVEDGAIIWFGPTGYVVDSATNTALESGLATATNVDCMIYEKQVAPPTLKIMEEVDVATQQPTGVLVVARIDSDGTVTYTNLADGTVYDPAAAPNTELTVTEDADYQLVETKGCDEGVNIARREWFKVGESAPVETGIIYNVSTGAVHTLSGNETWGAYCSATSLFSTPKVLCAKVRGVDGDIIAGTASEDVFQVIEYDAATGVPIAIKYYDMDNNEIVVGDAEGEYRIERGCC
jgi:hypothetical protein